MTTWDTGERRYRRRKRIRGPLTLLVLLGMLGGAAYFGWQTITEEEVSEAVQVCSTPDAEGQQEVTAEEVTVNVYNAGDVRGLGGSTAEQLRERGFTVGTVANDPEEAEVADSELRGRAKNAPEVQLLFEHIAGEDFVPDNRDNQEVDLVLGDEFSGLLEDAPAVLTVNSPLTTCRSETPAP